LFLLKSFKALNGLLCADVMCHQETTHSLISNYEVRFDLILTDVYRYISLF